MLFRRLRARLLPLVAFLAALLAPAAARAGNQDVVVLPTVTGSAQLPDDWHRPTDADPPAVARWARTLDGVIGEAVQDLGLTLDVSSRPELDAKDLTDQALVERAKDRWVVSPRIVFLDERTMRLGIRAVAPGSRVVLTEVDETSAAELELNAVVMLRDVVRTGQGRTATPQPPVQPPEVRHPVVERARSSGRAVLAVNAAALGGSVGFSLQRASGSTDPRLTYPLLALGAGVGLGASMIVADEWDVSIGDAWYLAAGTWWPGAAGLLLARTYDVPENNRYAYGLVGAGTGIVLATVSLSFGGMSEGGATMAHSGGAFGLLLGGLGDLLINGNTDYTPIRGMGYGAAAGVLIGGAAATQFRNVSNPTVLFIDLGASLGALVGAAAASPVLFVEAGSSETKNRIWLGSIAAGTLAGGAIAWWTMRATEGPSSAGTSSGVVPYAGLLGESRDRRGRTAPMFGAGLTGTF